mmetsp:Transcript_126145/g.315294  ORF Transcript_126145/g.315294 Transcript_126145/m.315294 type:complete len:342 (+) Transcript_126145:56-1081(+)
MNPNAAIFVPGQACAPVPPTLPRNVHKATDLDDVVAAPAALQALVRRLASERLLCIDCEGADLSKGSWRDGQLVQDPAVPLHGQICLLQIGTTSGEAFAIDIYELGAAAFDLGLRALLEDARIIKVVHDFRQDEDALWHQFRVRAQGLFDCQIADVFLRRLKGHRTGYVLGSAKLIANHGIELVSVPGYGAITQEQKLLIHERFSQDRHLWARRPLPCEMVQYAKADVLPLAKLFQAMLWQLTQHTGSEEVSQRLVRAGSVAYASSFRDLTACRCRLCCNAEENARFDGHKVFHQMASAGQVEPWLMQRLWRPEDANPLPPPGRSKFYVNEHDESVRLDSS